MNGNINLNLIAAGQQPQIIQTIYQPQLTYSSVQILPDIGLQHQHFQQASENNAQQSIQQLNGQTVCINQNGTAYLAVSPNPVQCVQALDAPHNVQLIQFVSNTSIQNSQHISLNPLCVHQVTPVLPLQTDFGTLRTTSAVDTNVSTNIQTFYNNQTPMCQQEIENVEENDAGIETTKEMDNSTTDGDGEETMEDSDLCGEDDENSASENAVLENDSMQILQDPIEALTNLTSSILPQTERAENQGVMNMIDNPSSMYSCSIGQNMLSTTNVNGSVPYNNIVQQPPVILSSTEQQMPSMPYQILVPTSQGVTIQTVLAGYPQVVNAIPTGTLVNFDTPTTPHLINWSPSAIPIALASATQQALSNNPIFTSNIAAATVLPAQLPATPTVLQVKSIASPTDIPQPCSQPSLSDQTSTNTVGTQSSIPGPIPSPQLPDSTDDLCQPTIKQATSSIVDGIDLEEIREFARTFKMRRLYLGLTQTQVGQALSATEGPAYSQSAICRFEKLDITPRSAMKIRPVLERWLREAEEKHQQGHSTGLEYIGISGVGKIRKRRTFFSPEALQVLNARFAKNSHPSGREVNNIATEIGYERDVVRVWFCNKRQSLRHSNTFQRNRVLSFKPSTLVKAPPLSPSDTKMSSSL